MRLIDADALIAEYCEDCELYELCCLDEGKVLDWLKQPVKDGEGE